MQTRKSSRLVIVDENGALLLFRYHDEHQAPFWATPGGELTPGEDYLGAARRELWEETGLDVAIGRVLQERDAIYPVARSQPARWLERYFLVRCSAQPAITSRGWTQEEQSTIRAWRWWTLAEMQARPHSVFKPEWLPELLERVLSQDAGDEGLAQA